MSRIISIVILVVHCLTLILAYDPATCIKCRKSHVCNPPECFCCRDEMPLDKHNIPQMVFFTFDDAVTPQVADYYKQLFESKRKNPNGCSISMTLFISHTNTVYRLVREFYDKGMEIASHSVTHSHPNPQTFIREAKKQRENLAKKAKIPEKDIVGWRSPFLEPLGDTQPAVLQQLGYEYDATLTITKKNNNDKAITPFTLDYGWPYDCKIKSCPKKAHKGFWEVPVVSVKDYLNKYDCVYVDGCNNPPPSEDLAFKFLWDNFQRYYKGNRAPMGINMHASWFYYPDRKAAMDRFIQELVKLDDVYVVSVKQVIAWLKNPTPLSQIKNFQPWQCNGKQPATNQIIQSKMVPKNKASGKTQTQDKPRQTMDRTQYFQKMAEQRNLWRRQQIQRERNIMSSFQARPIIPSIQPNNMQPSGQSDMMGQNSGIVPSVPAIPPLAPNHPMINFWWQPPPPGVLPPQVQHELRLRRMQQLEQQRQEAINRQRAEQERRRQMEAHRRAQEQQRLQLIKRRQEEERKRQLLVEKQEEQRRLRERERKLKEEKERLELEKRKLAEKKHKEALERMQKLQKTTQSSRNLVTTPKPVNHPKTKSKAGTLVEYLPTGTSANENEVMSKMELGIHRPPLREVHQQQLIKEKMKILPKTALSENSQKPKEPSVQTQNRATRVDGIIDEGSLVSTSQTLSEDKNTVKDTTITKPSAFDSIPNQIPSVKSNQVRHQNDNPSSSVSSARSQTKSRSHSEILDNILNYKPAERVKYLHDLSLEELKSLQAELRRRLKSDTTQSNESQPITTTDGAMSDVTQISSDSNPSALPKTTETPIINMNVGLLPTRESSRRKMYVPNGNGVQTASLTISLPSFSNPPSVNMKRKFTQKVIQPLGVENGIATAQAPVTSTVSTTTEAPTTTTTKTTKPPTTTEAYIPTTTEAYIPTTTTEANIQTTTEAPQPTTTETETTTSLPESTPLLTTIYETVTDRITEMTTKPPVSTTPDITTIASTEPTIPITESVTTRVAPITQAPTTKRPRVQQLSGTSLWDISDIFDMSNNINNGNAKPATKQAHSTSDSLTAYISQPKSLNLFSVEGHGPTATNSVALNKNSNKDKTAQQNKQGNQQIYEYQDMLRKATMLFASQNPASSPSLVPMTAGSSKSLFKVKGFGDNSPVIPSGGRSRNRNNRVSLEIPRQFNTELTTLTHASRKRVLPNKRHRIPPLERSETTSLKQTKASPTTTMMTTTTTTESTPQIEPSTPKPNKAVNKSFQHWTQTSNIFENNVPAPLGQGQATEGNKASESPSKTAQSKPNTNIQIPDIGSTSTWDELPVLNEADFLIPLQGSSRTPGSKCQQEVNCFSPDCVCKTDSTPNNIPVNKVPQIVYITIDGSLNFHTYSKIRQLFSAKRVNPNGCRIKGTLFVTDAGSNYRIADLLYSKGLELGLSGLSSRPQRTASELENSIISLTELITSKTSVSPIDIKGWRTPGFKPIGDAQYEILSNYSLYDSSLVTDREGKTPKLWPFTLDFGWQESCGERPCPTGYHAGVMEVPVMPFMGPGNSTACEYTDGCTKQPENEQQTLDYLMKNFNAYYKTNRAPFAIRLKQIWFHWYYRRNLSGLIKFLDKILAYKDVYVTSVSDMLDWVRDPTPLDKLDTFPSWRC